MTIKKLQTAGGIIFNDGLVLLIKSASRGSISIPKGRVEIGESLEETAVREVLEETGYRTKIVSRIDSINFKFEKDGEYIDKTVTYFKLRLLDDSVPLPNLQEGEDFENIWLSPEEALSSLTYDDAREVLKRAIESDAS